MNMGSWDIAVQIGSFPQKVASALTELEGTLVGAEYKPLAYIGSQVANGINHAVLAEQTILSGKDTTNVVVMIFNEKPNDLHATLVSIERILESGDPFGGVLVEPTELTDELEEMFNTALEGYVGATVTPYMVLGEQEEKGTNYIFAATLSTVAVEPEEKALLVIVNPLRKEVSMINMLDNKYEASLGYAFTW